MRVPSLSDSLDHWLNWLETLHPTEIEMGLARVGRVADRMALRPLSIPLILVGGTNGKGSTVSLLSEIYRHAGHRVGAYTSPHIDIFNERMSVDGRMLDDQTIVDALHAVEAARKPDTLTYFEYTTLAAMVAFNQMGCDLAVMEVGLGGRLDATNLWDADCAIITSIALDHQAYLGDTREAIAAEKVAIGRAGKPLIVGDVQPPENVFELAKAGGMNLLRINENALPQSALAGVHQQRNAACALMAIESLQQRLPVPEECIDHGLASVRIAGRFEQRTIQSQAAVFDVAHNPAAAETVRDALFEHYPDHEVYAVFSALEDKDIKGIVEALAPAVSNWFCAPLPVPRAIALEPLLTVISQSQVGRVSGYATIADAWQAALSSATGRKSVVLVAGSFFTLAQMQDVLVGNDGIAGEAL